MFVIVSEILFLQHATYVKCYLIIVMTINIIFVVYLNTF